jgi:5'-nucleotidase
VQFLLTNDDGIDAPGLLALEEALRGLGESVILAPDQHLSGCSHQATTQRPLTLTHLKDNRYCLDGTPVDCTRVGLAHLVPDCEWVIAGINAGGNLGADVYHSGTVAAAREGALMARRAIAVSQYVRREFPVDWQQSAAWTARVVRNLVELYPEPGALWNVNLPHLAPGSPLPEVVFCQLDPHPLPVEFRVEGNELHYCGRYHQRPREVGRDVERCFSGYVTVTQLLLD